MPVAVVVVSGYSSDSPPDWELSYAAGAALKEREGEKKEIKIQPTMT